MQTVIDNYTINFIKKFEKLNLTAQPSPFGFIIGYGHKGAKEGQKIDQKQANELLKLDYVAASDFVYNKEYVPFIDLLNNNQIAALVSFTFDCGSGSLKKLCSHPLNEIPNKILSFISIEGLPNEEAAKRRFQERELFIIKSNVDIENIKQIDQAMLNRLFDKKYTNPYPIPTKEFSRTICNMEQTKWLQTALKFVGYYNGAIDGIFGSDTYNAVRVFQKEYTFKKPDGVMDLESIAILEKLVK